MGVGQAEKLYTRSGTNLQCGLELGEAGNEAGEWMEPTARESVKGEKGAEKADAEESGVESPDQEEMLERRCQGTKAASWASEEAKAGEGALCKA